MISLHAVILTEPIFAVNPIPETSIFAVPVTEVIAPAVVVKVNPETPTNCPGISAGVPKLNAAA